MSGTLTKESAWNEMLTLTSQSGWEFNEQVLKRLEELRPYYWKTVRGSWENFKRGIAVRLTDSDGNVTEYPSKVKASQALGMNYNGIAQLTAKPDFCGYVMGYKVEVLDDNL